MESLEMQIGEWRAYMRRGRAVETPDIEELETHLRDQIADLGRSGLSNDEAFLVAVRRIGGVDALTREFALEHSDRLWKQLVITEEIEPDQPPTGLTEALVLAIAAAVVIQLPRLFVSSAELGPWYLRNASLLVLPFLAWYFVRRRHLGLRQALAAAAPFAVVAIVVNVYPWPPGSSSELLVAIHLPIVLWFAVAYPYMEGTWRSHERRMDFVRFTGEWIIYYVLIALGGGVLVGLTAFVLQPVGSEVAQEVVEWMVSSGAAGAVLVAAWLVGAKQSVVENMAPVLTRVFTPLFAVMLAGSVITYAVTGLFEFDRDVLSVFDVLLVVVLGLVLYGISARDSLQPAGLIDRVQLIAVLSALVLDLMVLGSMMTRIVELGFTPNRAAALGLNLVLLVNLAWAAWLTIRFIGGHITFHRLERWQTTYLPVFAVWAGVVVALLPPLFGFV